MALGNMVQPCHYATFLEALQKGNGRYGMGSQGLMEDPGDSPDTHWREAQAFGH
jgi:hypothetical protein